METLWDLPEELIDLVGKKMTSVGDIVRFGTVCKSWQSAIAIRKKKYCSSAPWLMLATYDDDDHHQGRLQKFFSLSSKTIFSLKVPCTKGRNCWGTPFGWLLTIGLDLNIHLLNPVSGIRLSLPRSYDPSYKKWLSAQHWRWALYSKFIVSSAPGKSDTTDDQSSCIVIEINYEKSGFAIGRPGDNAWKYIETPHQCYQDAIYFQGQFYVLTTRGQILVCDINNEKTTDVASPPTRISGGNEYYLVDMYGALHFVERVIVGNYNTYSFVVYKFDFHTKCWTQISGFDDYAMFLGTNTSFAILIAEFPEFKASCIYYTDDHTVDHHNDCCDMGVYDFVKKTREPIYSGENMCSGYSCPVFFVPVF